MGGTFIYNTVAVERIIDHPDVRTNSHHCSSTKKSVLMSMVCRYNVILQNRSYNIYYQQEHGIKCTFCVVIVNLWLSLFREQSYGQQLPSILDLPLHSLFLNGQKLSCWNVRLHYETSLMLLNLEIHFLFIRYLLCMHSFLLNFT